MHSFKTISLLAFAATTAFALPTPSEEANALEARAPQWRGGNRYWQRPSDDATIETWGYGESAPTDTTETPSTPAAPAAPADTWAPAQPSTPAETETPSTETPSVGTGGDWFSIVQKWRSAGGLPALSRDSTLEANALKTSTASTNGLTHQLNPGTFAQVLAPGSADNFESVYVGGWLCEIPSLPGLDGICSSASQGWNHAGQTGHAEILSSKTYKSVGCALSGTGVWACDLA